MNRIVKQSYIPSYASTDNMDSNSHATTLVVRCKSVRDGNLPMSQHDELDVPRVSYDDSKFYNLDLTTV